MHPQVFSATPKAPLPDYVTLSKDHLRRNDLLGKNQDNSTPVGFDLPPLHGASLDEHFHRIGLDAAEPWLSLSKKLARASPPPKPRKWIKRSGWTKYHSDGSTEQVDAPNEELITFDTEVMWRVTSFPAMACAVSPTAWYGWLSPWLLGESESDRHLIPLGNPQQPRIVVGHNIGYDRARVAEEYNLEQSKTFFMDTMSLHVAVNGMCTRQRPTWMKHRKARDSRDAIANSDEAADMHALLNTRDIEDEEEHLWISQSSVNSLRDVAKFHCGITIDKSRREYFGELNREDIANRFDELLDYCAADVDITHRVFRKVFPAFVETCPHPVSFAALRHLSAEILPVNESWEKYLENAEATYNKLLVAVQQRLLALTEKALEIKEHPELYENDPWLRQLDWSGQEIKMAKPKKKGEAPKPVKRQKMPGMPAWYKDLFPAKDGPINLTVRTRIAPLLLRLSWDTHPLVWSQKYGWTFKVQNDKAGPYQSTAIECDMMEEVDPNLKSDTQNTYFKLPHKDGPAARCASPLAKGYLAHFEKGTLSSEFPYAKEALEMNASCSYWISARDRIRGQMVIYSSDLTSADSEPASDDPKPSVNSAKLGYILPQIIPMGTITRRAVENTWLTAANAKHNRVGSELKSMIVAPPGYTFVGADVDSQELWIASLMGDAQFGLHGGSAIGFMTLEGSKAAGTDMHSRTAAILGIGRNDAKVFNYGRIYGAGLAFAGTLLRQFSPTLPATEAAATASHLYAATKGARTTRRTLHPRAFWRGGSESVVFNALEDFAERDAPRTPALGAGITQALLRRFVSRGEFMTSRVNWAIQSSGVDYLHLLVVAMDHLTRLCGLDLRLAITVHDEIRYLVRDEDALRAAMALQVANVWTRALFAQQLGMDDLPQGCAFFSAIDVDRVLRKEVDMDCVTPSNPIPIPPGQRFDIEQLLARGEDARLIPVPADTPGRPDPARFAYEPRTPVLGDLQSERNLPYLRAQVSSTDEELREILKDVKLAETMRDAKQAADLQKDGSPTKHPTPKATRKRSTRKSAASSKDDDAGAGTQDGRYWREQGILLPEAPWLERRLPHAWAARPVARTSSWTSASHLGIGSSVEKGLVRNVAAGL